MRTWTICLHLSLLHWKDLSCKAGKDFSKAAHWLNARRDFRSPLVGEIGTFSHQASSLWKTQIKQQALTLGIDIRWYTSQKLHPGHSNNVWRTNCTCFSCLFFWGSESYLGSWPKFTFSYTRCCLHCFSSAIVRRDMQAELHLHRCGKGLYLTGQSPTLLYSSWTQGPPCRMENWFYIRIIIFHGRKDTSSEYALFVPELCQHLVTRLWD